MAWVRQSVGTSSVIIALRAGSPNSRRPPTAKASTKLPEGEENLGFNLFLGYENDSANFIRAGVDYMRNCTMSGGHQMDLRLECD